MMGGATPALPGLGGDASRLSQSLDLAFGSTVGSFLLRDASSWRLFPPAGGPGFIFCGGTGNIPFYSTPAAGSTGDLQVNSGSGFFSAISDSYATQNMQPLIRGLTYAAPPGVSSVTFIPYYDSDTGAASSMNPLDLANNAVVAASDNNAILMNNNGALFGSAGDLQYDFGAQILATIGLQASYLTLATPLDIIYGGTGGRVFDGGRYTPTFTNVANIAANTNSSCNWERNGDQVTVSGTVFVDPTLAATSTQLGISLPVASNFTNASDCGGVGAAIGVAGMSAGILADTTNDRAQMQWISSDITNQQWQFTFTYTIQ